MATVVVYGIAADLTLQSDIQVLRLASEGARDGPADRLGRAAAENATRHWLVGCLRWAASVPLQPAAQDAPLRALDLSFALLMVTALLAPQGSALRHPSWADRAATGGADTSEPLGNGRAWEFYNGIFKRPTSTAIAITLAAMLTRRPPSLRDRLLRETAVRARNYGPQTGRR